MYQRNALMGLSADNVGGLEDVWSFIQDRHDGGMLIQHQLTRQVAARRKPASGHPGGKYEAGATANGHAESLHL
jgi:hypothetical protein